MRHGSGYLRTNTTIFRLNLLQFGIRPSASDKVNPLDFAAREISDVGITKMV